MQGTIILLPSQEDCPSHTHVSDACQRPLGPPSVRSGFRVGRGSWLLVGVHAVVRLVKVLELDRLLVLPPSPQPVNHPRRQQPHRRRAAHHDPNNGDNLGGKIGDQRSLKKGERHVLTEPDRKRPLPQRNAGYPVISSPPFKDMNGAGNRNGDPRPRLPGPGAGNTGTRSAATHQQRWPC